MNNGNISHEGTKTRRNREELSRIVMDCAYRMHVEIGPGLLESSMGNRTSCLRAFV